MSDIMKLGLIISATDRTGGGINSAIGKLGKLSGALGLAGAAYMGFDAVKKYDDAVQSLSAVTGVTGAGLDEMKIQVMSLAKEARKSGYDIAQSFENVGSNMSEYLSDPKGLRQITAAGITLSKAARMEVAPALDNLTTIMNQFDLKAKEAERSVNILTAGEIVGSVRTAEISSSLQEFGASAAGANVNLGESVAMIEVLGKKMDKSKIGVAGRNILTALSAAKGLDKDALKYLNTYGVSTDKLMNSQLPLIDRLTELSKISGDATAMVKVFGKENITAATILLKNLPLYKDWEHQIQNTNKAQEQAQTNSKSFANRLKELKSAFENKIIVANEGTGALSGFGNVLGFVTNHISGLVNLILLVSGVTLGYIAIVKIIRIATTLWNVALGINAALTRQMPISMAKNTVALKTYAVASKIVTAAQWLWNAAMTANPIGAIIVGVVALGAGLVYLVKHWDSVIAVMKKFGMFLLKVFLAPIRIVLEAIGKLTGAKWAINASAAIKQFTTESTKENASKALADKALSKQNIGGGNLNYSPNVTINGPVSQTDKDNFKKLLNDHKKEIIKINKDNQSNNARIAYAQ